MKDDGADTYLAEEAEAGSLWADPKYSQIWRGGTGECMIAGNYGWGEVVKNGCHQMLWLHGDEQRITHVGPMNIFLHWINETGVEELATPPLNDAIPPGATRQSILELTRKWGEFEVTERDLNMSQLRSALKEQRIKAFFGSGTACLIRPINKIVYQEENLCIPCQDKSPTSRIAEELTDTQYGRTPGDCTFLV